MPGRGTRPRTRQHGCQRQNGWPQLQDQPLPDDIGACLVFQRIKISFILAPTSKLAELPSLHLLSHHLIFAGEKTSTSIHLTNCLLSFPGGSADKESACNMGDPGSIPGSGRSSGKGNGNPLQYSCPVGCSPCGHKESSTSCIYIFSFTDQDYILFLITF